jgi:hypothetical protein
MNDMTRLPLLIGTGPGLLPQDPLALVVSIEASQAFGGAPEYANSRSEDATPAPFEPRYRASLSWS